MNTHYRLSFASALLLFVSLTVQCSVSGPAAGDSAVEYGPVIGVSSGFSNGKISVSDEYLVSVSKAGGVPMVLPLVRDAESARSVVSHIDGILMTGGEDVNPAYFGETPVNNTVSINAVRDTSDMLLLLAARDAGIPVLGICRGEQIVNVFYGGSLIQDIPAQIADPVSHRQHEPKRVGSHMIHIAGGSILHGLLDTDSLMVNSFHHQAVNTPAPCFVITATTSDGIVEAFESADHSILCTQFHPEGPVSAGDDSMLSIFSWLVREASRRARP